MNFNRKDYYSQTEACKVYGLSIKKFKSLIEAYSLPQLNRKIDLGGYEVTTIYILKKDLDKIISQIDLKKV